MLLMKAALGTLTLGVEKGTKSLRVGVMTMMIKRNIPAYYFTFTLCTEWQASEQFLQRRTVLTSGAEMR